MSKPKDVSAGTPAWGKPLSPAEKAAMERAARERGNLVGLRKQRGPAPRVTDSRDKVIVEQARELTRWKHRAERAEALVEVQKKVAALLGTPLDIERS